MTGPGGRALVLTAGFGTRLRPLTYCRAKPAVPVAGRPLVHRILRWLAREGVRDLVLNLHYKPETIARAVGDGGHLGVRVRYSWEPRLLGSAGGPRHALPLMAPRFFLVNGDTLTDMSLAEIERAHERTGALVTLAVVPNPAPDRYGGIIADAAGRVVGFTRAGDSRPSDHFAGVQVADEAAFRALPDEEPARTIPDWYMKLLAADPGAVRVHRCDAVFHDIGTPAEYLRTSLRIAAAEGAAELPRGDGARVHPTTQLVRTALWDDVVVEAGCELVECVVGDGARVPAGSRFERKAIVPARVVPGSQDRSPADLLVAPLDAREAEAPGGTVKR